MVAGLQLLHYSYGLSRILKQEKRRERGKKKKVARGKAELGHRKGKKCIGGKKKSALLSFYY